MKVVIIGGTGHVGTFLVPRLVMDGHEVICISRQENNPYNFHMAWKSVKMIMINRVESDKKKIFGKQIQDLKPDVVIDLICFTLESVKNLVEALQGSVQHFIHCGTTWVHGHSELVPTVETQKRNPIGHYGINKASIESYLISVSRQNGFPVTILHPGHIVGPGWIPINPTGNLNPNIFKRLAEGKEIILPNNGMETLHHVHADDVAQSFMKALGNWNSAVGESFHIVSEQALTLRGYATAMAAWHGKEAKLSFLPWEEWKKTVNQRDAEITWDHLTHSPNFSIEKAKKLLNYQPHYTSLQAIQESVKQYFEKNQS